MEISDYHFIPLNEAERFDTVVVRTVERWKESELSGDEWRYSYTADFFSHGVYVGNSNGRSVEACLANAAADYNRIKDETAGGYYGDLENRCCQPACEQLWIHLLHPVKKYARNGSELVRPYSEKDVRGFCERHKYRGDCGLDDADYNYIAVAYRNIDGTLMPPDPNVGNQEE